MPDERDDRDRNDSDELAEEDRTGAYSWDSVLDEDREVPEAFENPAGAARGACDEETTVDASCDVEATALTEDQVLEESMPGIGISGFEGEEVGGG
jgi:hypothetical protein